MALTSFGPKRTRTLPVYLTVPEITRLLRKLRQDATILGQRDFIIIATFLYCGLRVAELALAPGRSGAPRGPLAPGARQGGEGPRRPHPGGHRAPAPPLPGHGAAPAHRDPGPSLRLRGERAGLGGRPRAAHPAPRPPARHAAPHADAPPHRADAVRGHPGPRHQPPQAPALLRHAPPRGRGRYAARPGAARAQRHHDHGRLQSPRHRGPPSGVWSG